MGYNKDVYAQANRIIEERHNNAINLAEKHKIEVYKKIPRIEQISRELSSHGIKAAKAVLNGQNTAEQLQKLKEISLSLQNEKNEILKSHGYSEKYLEPDFTCKKCNDMGKFEDMENNKTLVCPCYNRLLTEVACEQLNKISPLSLSTFDSFLFSRYPQGTPEEQSVHKRMKLIFDFCKKYAENFSLSSESLLMKGATGLGKTHLSLAIANEIIKKGFGVIYVSAPSILSKLEKEHFSYNYEDESATEKTLFDCDLLIIDDLGTEFISNYSKAEIYNIFNNRLLSGKPIILNTNFTIKELEKNYSQRFVSRIAGACVKLDFIGKDQRAV